MATHLATVGRTMNLDVRNVRVIVRGRYRTEGSALRGDRTAYADGFTMEVEVDSDEPPERINEYIRRGEAECYTIVALRNPTPVDLTARVNGQAFDLGPKAAS